MVMSLGASLRTRRQALHLTQRQVADRVGIHFTYISKLEHDRWTVPPSEAVIRRLAEVLEGDAERWLELAGILDGPRLQALAAHNRVASRVLRRIQTGRITPDQWKRLEALFD
jgi:transcriptional regulator with XRE-family HTH domain